MPLTIIADSLELLIRISIALIAIVISYYLGGLLSNYVRKTKVRAAPEVIYNLARAIKLVFLFIGFLV
ncbi:MAG: hypothetical protein QXJ83_03125, partial [Sulfolobales archaeon]